MRTFQLAAALRCHPRVGCVLPGKHFKEDFIPEYFAGFAHKPGTTYGTVNKSICERLIPSYKAPNAIDLIAASPFPDSE